MNKNYYWKLLTFMMVAMLSFGFASCGSDDDDEKGSDSVLVGEWQECEDDGTLLNDAKEYEVHHTIFNSDGKGEYWSVSKGKTDRYKYSFTYTYTFSGSSGTINMTITASTNNSDIGEVAKIPFTLKNGILHVGEIYYKKISGGIDDGSNDGNEDKTVNYCPDKKHPHMIDLGLPSGTKWACCNVGASTPEDFGESYAWGETESSWGEPDRYQYSLNYS